MRPSLALVLVLLLTGIIRAQTVRPVPSLLYPTIQSAIDASVDGDVIDIGPGTYLESLLVSSKGLTLRGQGAGVTSIDGQGIFRCLAAYLPPGASLKLQQLGLLDGATTGPTNQEGDHQGGCLWVADANTPAEAALIELSDCLVANGRAANGGGLYAGRHHQLLLSRCQFQGNGPGANYASMVSLPSGFAVLCRGDLIATDTSFTGNIAGLAAGGNGSGGAIRIEALASQGGFLLDCKRCDFLGNVAGRGGAISAVAQMGTGSQPGNVKLENCALVGNGSALAGSRAAALELAYTDCWARSTLIARNSSVGSPDLIENARRLELVHCTVVENGIAVIPTPGPHDLTSYNSFANLRNCIIAKNRAATNFRGLAGSSPPTIITSLLEALPAPGAPSLDLGFVDAAGGDYRLLPLSPAVDMATAVYGAGVDLDGAPRKVGPLPDAGCYENQVPGPVPGTEGTVLDGMGQPMDVLLVNSSAGNGRRNLHLAPGAFFGLEVLQPQTNPQPANFLLWGRLGVPTPGELFPIYFAGGAMAFAPHVVAPSNPLLFTLTNSYEPPPVSGIVASSPAPWSIGAVALPFPATMTLQGLIETGNGQVRITNALVISTY